MNLILRDILYNQYLCKHFSFNKIAPWLELPVDSLVAKALIKSGNTPHAKWKSIKSLKEKQNRIYQDAAISISRNKNMNPIHLDIYFTTGEQL